MKCLLPILFLSILPSVHAEINFELSTSPADSVISPDEKYRHQIEIQMGTNETGDSPLIVNLMWDTDAANFSQYNKFIVILGGPDAYEGIGDKVKEALTESEQASMLEEGNSGMYVKTNVWTKWPDCNDNRRQR